MANHKVTLIMYHYTRDLKHSRYPEIKGLDSELFEEQLQFLRDHYNVIRMEDLISCAENHDFPDHAAVLTFDDGYIDNYTVAMPLLQKYGMQGSFFIPGKSIEEHVLLDVNKIHFVLASAPVEELKAALIHEMDSLRRNGADIPDTDGLYRQYAVDGRYDTKDTVFVKKMLQTVLPEDIRKQISSALFEKYVGIDEGIFARELYLNHDQIRCMKRSGMFIGIHGYAHNWLGNLSTEEMQSDISRALGVMKEYIDPEHWVMNYPYGSFSSDVVAFCRSKGCCMGIATTVGTADLDIDDVFALPRLNCNDFPPKSNNYLKF